MSSNSFLMALKRFASRRGEPDSLVCDNAQQFKTVRASRPFEGYLSSNGVKWQFIPQLSPWSGGFYERLVKVVKSALKKTIGCKLLTDEELSTVMTEAEHAVNSRPLIHVSDDINDSLLTPNNILGVKGAVIAVSPGRDYDKDFTLNPSTKKDLLWSAKSTRKASDRFWNTWTSEYLLSLRERHHWSHKDPKGSIATTPRVGEVVLVKDPSQPRNKWKFGKISQLLSSKDGSIRSVMVALSNKNVIRRPVNLLYPLEAEERPSDESEESSKVGTESKEFSDVDTGRGCRGIGQTGDKVDRPRRVAAVKASDRIRSMLLDE